MMNLNIQDPASQSQMKQIENLISQITRFHDKGVQKDLFISSGASTTVANLNYKSLLESEKAPKI
jgi:hypothetical protein